GAFDALRHLGKCHFAVERRKNGAADESRAAQTGQDSAAKPLYGDPAAIDHRSLGAIDGKWRLVTEIDDPGLASIAAPAWRLLAQPCVPPNSIDLDKTFARSRPHVFVLLRERFRSMALPHAWKFGNQGQKENRPETRTSMVSRSLEVSWPRGKDDGFLEIACPV